MFMEDSTWLECPTVPKPRRPIIFDHCGNGAGRMKRCMATFTTATVMIIAVIGSATEFEHAECVMSESNRCAFSSMRQPTLVYPGGETRCAFDDGDGRNATYRFQVVPGKHRHNKVLLMFQGGGGCFSAESCTWHVSEMVKGVMRIPIFENGATPQGPHGVWGMMFAR